MKLFVPIALLLSVITFTSQAHNLKIGHSVPVVKVQHQGEIFWLHNKITFAPWSSSQMVGKVRIIQAIAGRSSAKAMNARLMQAITKAEFDSNRYQTTTIVNQDDSIWGTGSFVKSSAISAKKEYPWSSIVLDENGQVAARWHLKPESSAIIVQDKNGKILYIHEGKLSQDEIEHVLHLVQVELHS